MPDPIKFVNVHPQAPGETHYLTVWDIEPHLGHRHVRVDTECGFTAEGMLFSGGVRDTGEPPTCRECFNHGLNPKALSDVLGALTRAGDLPEPPAPPDPTPGGTSRLVRMWTIEDDA